MCTTDTDLVYPNPRPNKGCTSRATRIAAVVLPCVFLLLAPGVSGQEPTATIPVEKPPLSGQRLSVRALAFEETQDPGSHQTGYVARGNGHTLFLTNDEAVLSLARSEFSNSARRSSIRTGVTPEQQQLRLGFVGANPDSTISGEQPLPGKIYFAGAQNGAPSAGGPTFRRVKYSNIYAGI